MHFVRGAHFGAVAFSHHWVQPNPGQCGPHAIASITLPALLLGKKGGFLVRPEEFARVRRRQRAECFSPRRMRRRCGLLDAERMVRKWPSLKLSSFSVSDRGSFDVLEFSFLQELLVLLAKAFGRTLEQLGRRIKGIPSPWKKVLVVLGSLWPGRWITTGSVSTLGTWVSRTICSAFPRDAVSCEDGRTRIMFHSVL